MGASAGRAVGGGDGGDDPPSVLTQDHPAFQALLPQTWEEWHKKRMRYEYVRFPEVPPQATGGDRDARIQKLLEAHMRRMTYTVAPFDIGAVKTCAEGDACEIETVRSAARGDLLVRGPLNEIYVVTAAKANQVFVTTPAPDTRSVGFARMPDGSAPVYFVASFGEAMALQPGDALVQDSTVPAAA
jgi:hypothetical protein